jgi:Fe2+ or Zn2+ uptake regulation protein
MAVYEALRETKSHPTAEEIFRVVKPTTAKLSLATVYNTLDALCNAGLIRRMPTANGCCRYDADTSLHLHVCYRDSQRIEDVPEDLSKKLIDRLPQDVLDEIGRTLGVKIDGVSIQLQARS